MATKKTTAKAETKNSSTKKNTRSQKGTDKLNAQERHGLRSSDFGIPEKREFPMPDAAHVRSAEAYFRYASEKEKPMLAHRIMMKAKKYGVDIESDNIRSWAKKK